MRSTDASNRFRTSNTPDPETSVNAWTLWLLWSWSYRRVRSRTLFWLRFLRLIVDWISLVYIILPGAAVFVYVAWRYFHGAFTSSIGNSAAVGGLSVKVLLVLVVTAILVVWHIATYGNIPFSLEAGDKVYTFLSPIPRPALLLVLFAEGTVYALLFALLLFALTIPWLSALHVARVPWFITTVALSAYESGLRLVGQLQNDRDAFTWRRWMIYQTGRILSVLPVVICVPWVLAGSNWLATSMFIAIVLGFMALGYHYLLSRTWDGWMQFRPSRLINLAVPVDVEDVSKVQFRMRLPSVWLVRIIERSRGNPLTPMTWLLVLRILRRKQLFRDLGLLTVAAVMDQRLTPSIWVKLFGIGFCVLMFFQWWTITVRPLADKPIEEQPLEDPWALRVQANRLMVGTMLTFIIFWFVLGWLL